MRKLTGFLIPMILVIQSVSPHARASKTTVQGAPQESVAQILSQIEQYKTDIQQMRNQINGAQARIVHGRKMYRIYEPAAGWGGVISAMTSASCLALDFTKRPAWGKVTCRTAFVSGILALVAAGAGDKQAKAIILADADKLRFNYELLYDQARLQELADAYAKLNNLNQR